MYLSVIVPAYNEEKNLENNIKLFNAYLQKQAFDYEIIIVNDGSTDITLALAQKLSMELPAVKVLNKTKNEGKGAAIRDGLLGGQGDYLLFLDADNASSIDHLEKTWPLLKDNCDVVIGSRNYRDVPGAKQARPQNIIKRFLGSSGNILIRALTGSPIYDTQCGFKIFNKKSVALIFPKSTINRWAIDIEVLTIAKKHQLKVGIIPITWVCGPNSRVGLSGYLSALRELFIIKANYWLGKYN